MFKTYNTTTDIPLGSVFELDTNYDPVDDPKTIPQFLKCHYSPEPGAPSVFKNNNGVSHLWKGNLSYSVADLLDYGLGTDESGTWQAYLRKGLGSDSTGSWIPFFVRAALGAVGETRLQDPTENTTIGQASFSQVKVDSPGYYGVADVNSYGLYQLDSVTGLPSVRFPYLRQIATQLDLPTSQAVSQIQQTDTSNTNRIIAAIGSGGSGGATEATLEQVLSVVTHIDQERFASLLDDVSYVDTSGTPWSVAHSMYNDWQANKANGLLLNNMSQTLSQMLTQLTTTNANLAAIQQQLQYAPPKTLTNNGSTIVRANYPAIGIGELLYRSAFTAQPQTLVIDISGNQVVQYVSVPSSSLLCPISSERSGSNFVAPFVQPANPSSYTVGSVHNAFASYDTGWDPFVDPTGQSTRMPSGCLTNAVLAR